MRSGVVRVTIAVYYNNNNNKIFIKHKPVK